MKKIGILIISVFLLAACSSKEFQKSPVDDLIRDMSNIKDYTIILYDMDMDGSFSTTYKHKYKVITEKDSVPVAKETDWYEVSEDFFYQHEADMGMEVASKTDGKVTKQTAPPGYTKYVGNSSYGSWKTNSNGSSFWAFYGQYAFMSNMMGLMGGPVYRNHYTDYRSNYYGRKPYYGGTTGKPTYGSYSSTALKSNPKSRFSSKVQGRVSKSGSSTSRSGSRYGTSSSSTRSRSSSSRGGK